ncbi:Cleavage stimulation factor subunit 1, partial [Galemys pyrenaicus]
LPLKPGDCDDLCQQDTEQVLNDSGRRLKKESWSAQWLFQAFIAASIISDQGHGRQAGGQVQEAGVLVTPPLYAQEREDMMACVWALSEYASECWGGQRCLVERRLEDSLHTWPAVGLALMLSPQLDASAGALLAGQPPSGTACNNVPLEEMSNKVTEAAMTYITATRARLVQHTSFVYKYATGHSDIVAPGTGIRCRHPDYVPRSFRRCAINGHWLSNALIKTLDMERMLAKSAVPREVMMNETAQQSMENHPILASRSRDYMLKLFDYSKPTAKRAFRELKCCSISFYPSRDFIILGTQHPTLRLYESNTFQCFVSQSSRSANRGHDSCIKLWDGISNQHITAFEKARNDAEVCSAISSKNFRYIFSQVGKTVAKLREIATGRTLVRYMGASLGGRQVHGTQAVFSHTQHRGRWHSRTAQRRHLLAMGHSNTVRCNAPPPTSPGFKTCSDDLRVLFGYTDSTTD